MVCRKPTWQEDYCQTISKRIRVACRHIKQAWIKARSAKTSWVAGFMPEPAGEPEDEVYGHDEEEDEGEDENLGFTCMLACLKALITCRELSRR
eukprot:3996645-Amphidinium_carterae.1